MILPVDFLLFSLVMAPLCVLTGFGASVLGFTGWFLVVPTLFVVFGFDLHLTIMMSLLVDLANALLLAVFSVIRREADLRLGLLLSLLASIFAIPGIVLGVRLITEHQEVFRGSIGVATLVIGILFLCRGSRLARLLPTTNSGATPPPAASVRERAWVFGILLPGTAGTGFLTGLIGIGGGANFAVFLMISKAFSYRKATGTAMVASCCLVLFTITGILIRLPNEVGLDATKMFASAFLTATSLIGAAVGAKITSSLTEHRMSYLIGAVLIVVSLIGTARKLWFS